MTEETQTAAISSAFPAPPPFSRSFTSWNLERLQEHLESSHEKPSDTFQPTNPVSHSIPDVTTIPVELRNLVPPLPPPNGIYHTFGTVHNISHIPFADIPPPPSQDDLLSLVHQVLLKFLHITHILSIDPAMKLYGPAWDQLEALLQDVHGGINAWRPHQARETLIRMLEGQIEGIKAETQMVSDGVEKARKVVDEIANGKLGGTIEGTVNGEQGFAIIDQAVWRTKAMEKQKRLWRVIESHVGFR
ncbi:MAG: hypothetical protein Q9164_003292 [Protoblastenia rupestris]